MLRIPALLPLLLLGLTQSALAQQSTQKPSDQPPKLERIEEGSDTPVTITPQAPRTKITEKKDGGRVTEVTVTTGKSTYTLKPALPAGNAQPQDAQSSAIRAPQWEVLQFDLFKKKQKEKDEEPASPAPVPPPPPPASEPVK